MPRAAAAAKTHSVEGPVAETMMVRAPLARTASTASATTATFDAFEAQPSPMSAPVDGSVLANVWMVSMGM